MLCDVPYLVQCFEQIKNQDVYPIQYPDDTLSRDIQIDSYHLHPIMKTIYQIEDPEASVVDKRILHKVVISELIQQFRFYQQSRITHRQTSLSFTMKIWLQQAINPVYTLKIQAAALSSEFLK